MKKIRNRSGRNEIDDARRLNDAKPEMILDHLVKERYPRFIDALRDLDDALCMIHMFAALPSLGRITAERTNSCKDLCRQWQYYVARSKSLHKVYVSVKGVYYQSVVMGEAITWLAPHQFTQSIPREVDIRVMMTFLEFYETFIRFVLFKLYSTLGLRFPPEEDKTMKDSGGYLLAMKAIPIEQEINSSDAMEEVEIEEPKVVTKIVPKIVQPVSSARIASLGKKLKEIEEKEEKNNEIVDTKSTVNKSNFHNNDGDDEETDKTFVQVSDDIRPNLFSKVIFFVNREVPLDWLQLCTISFGAQIGWSTSSSPYGEDDPSITHHIVDRPIQGMQLKTTREYVQPQWVFDSINSGMLLPVHKYAPGSALPPHLSPFVDDAKEGYMPTYREEIMSLQDKTPHATAVATKIDDAMDSDDENDENTYNKELLAEKKGKSYSKSKAAESESEEEEEEGSSSDEEEVVKAPVDSKKGAKGIVHKVTQKKLTETEEDQDLAKSMMSKKTKRLYGRMQHGIEKKQEVVSNLEVKRKALDTTNSTKKSNKKK